MIAAPHEGKIMYFYHVALLSLVSRMHDPAWEQFTTYIGRHYTRPSNLVRVVLTPLTTKTSVAD